MQINSITLKHYKKPYMTLTHINNAGQSSGLFSGRASRFFLSQRLDLQRRLNFNIMYIKNA